MRFSHFFIDRPIFATVLSLIVTIVGLIAQRALPVSEYPEIAPPTVNITATYPGASAPVIAETVAAPIEQEVNGVDNMLYINSQSTGDGRLSINVVFKPGTNIDQAQVLVQNRVAVAEPRLPEDVRRLGIPVRKASPDLMMVVHMLSPDASRDQSYISNYATLYVKDVLTRVDGVGNVNIFGARDYSMRVWLDPAKVAARGLTASEVIIAMRTANLQVAAGSINQAPATSPGAFTLTVQTLGRLSAPEEFGNIVIRAGADGSVVRVRDVARVELGSQDYTVNAYLNNKVATAVVFQAGFNAPQPPPSRRDGADGRNSAGVGTGGLQVRVHPGVDRRGHQDVVGGRAARRPRRHPLSADVARGDHPDRRHSGVADRHLRRDGRRRHHLQLAVAVRSGARHRYRGRDAICRGRECRRYLPVSSSPRPRTRPWTRWAARWSPSASC
jgi:hypothetical protein